MPTHLNESAIGYADLTNLRSGVGIALESGEESSQKTRVPRDHWWFNSARLWPVDDDRAPFRRAVASGLVGPLSAYGFRLGEASEGVRGAEALVANDHLVIRVLLDRLEGQLVVSVGVIGGTERPIGHVVDLSRLKGLKSSRLRRDVSSEMIETQLRKLADALAVQASSALTNEGEAIRLLGS